MFGYKLDNKTYEDVIKKNDKYFFSLSDLSTSDTVKILMSKNSIPYIFLREQMSIDEDDVKVIATLSYISLSSSPTSSNSVVLKHQNLFNLFTINQLLLSSNTSSYFIFLFYFTFFFLFFYRFITIIVKGNKSSK
jgi:hypothetical protein